MFMALIAALLPFSCAYRSSTHGLTCLMTNSWKGNTLEVEASLENAGPMPVNVCQNRNFSSLDPLSVDHLKMGRMELAFVSWSKATPKSLITIQKGESTLIASWSWEITPIGRNKWRVSDGTMGSYETTDPILRVHYSYNWAPDYLPRDARKGQRWILRSKLSAFLDVDLRSRNSTSSSTRQ